MTSYCTGMRLGKRPTAFPYLVSVQVMAPVEDNADAHDRNRVEVGLRRSYGRDNSRFHRYVEPGVRLNHQTGTLVHRERPEQAVFKNGKLHLKRVQGNKSGVDRRHPGRQDQKGMVGVIVIKTQ